MLQQSYKCDDQGGPQPPKPWKEGDDPSKKPSDKEDKQGEKPKPSVYTG